MVKHSSVESVVQCEIDEVSAQLGGSGFKPQFALTWLFTHRASCLNFPGLFLSLKSTLEASVGGSRQESTWYIVGVPLMLFLSNSES